MSLAMLENFDNYATRRRRHIPPLREIITIFGAPLLVAVGVAFRFFGPDSAQALYYLAPHRSRRFCRCAADPHVARQR